jgi:hypothetical protein
MGHGGVKSYPSFRDFGAYFGAAVEDCASWIRFYALVVLALVAIQQERAEMHCEATATTAETKRPRRHAASSLKTSPGELGSMRFQSGNLGAWMILATSRLSCLRLLETEIVFLCALDFADPENHDAGQNQTNSD